MYIGKWCMGHSLRSMFIFFQGGIPCRWAHDSQRFLLESFDLISKSPSHIYHSALPLSPSSSWLHKCYTAHLLQNVKVVKGIPDGWGTCSRTVTLDTIPIALTCQKDTIAVGCKSRNIIILNAITGSQVAILSGHADWVRSITFSSDGILLVSGSDDKTVKLWDFQTGGVIKTLHGHTSWVYSVSISPDGTTLASGSGDNSIRLWGVQKGICLHVMDGHSKTINSISFSPTNSQHLISACEDNTVQQWDINGYQIGPAYEGNHAVFSPDGTQFVSWREQVATVRDSKSGAVVAKLQVPSGQIHHCCFSPSGEFITGSDGRTIYVWDITSSDPCLLKTLVGHARPITSLTFSSSLISVSEDKSVKFWQIGGSSTDQLVTDTISTPPTSASIESVSLQAGEGIAISSDSDGVVRTWDILTGLCKVSFQTPAKDYPWRDAQLVGGRLITVWHAEDKLHIWDTEKDELLHTVDIPDVNTIGLRISGDGSKVFLLTWKYIQSWYILTGEAVDKVELKDPVELKDQGRYLDPLHADGSRIWVQHGVSLAEGWDFGILDSSPIPLSSAFPNRPHLNFLFSPAWVGADISRVEDTTTGKEVFQLVGSYAQPREARWDGHYLVAGYGSGEVLILDFNQVGPQ